MGPRRKSSPHVELERVAVDDLETLPRETLAKEIHQPPILFDRQNSCARRQCRLSQGAEARSDFNHEIRRGELRLLHDPAREILIVQEILPECLHRHNADFLQDVSDF